MYEVLRFTEEHLSSYALFLLLLSALILIFIDAGHLKKKGLNKESGFSFIAGILYASLGVALFIWARFFVSIR